MDATLQSYLQRLDEAHAGFIEEISAYSREQRATSENNGWNMLQVMEHIIISEKGTFEYLKRKTSAAYTEIPLSDGENEKSSQQLNAALVSDKRWAAPQVLPPPTGTQSLENMVAYWDRLREDLEHFLLGLQPEYYHRQIFKHPFSGRLDLFQTLEFLIHHIAHHRHQLKRIAGVYKDETAV